jgi:hypothetical protein
MAAKQVIFDNIKSHYTSATSVAGTSIAPGLAGKVTLFGKSMRWPISSHPGHLSVSGFPFHPHLTQYFFFSAITASPLKPQKITNYQPAYHFSLKLSII